MQDVLVRPTSAGHLAVHDGLMSDLSVALELLTGTPEPNQATQHDHMQLHAAAETCPNLHAVLRAADALCMYVMEDSMGTVTSFEAFGHCVERTIHKGIKYYQRSCTR